MLRLRPYKPCDAKYIVSWIKDEVSFKKWCSIRLDTYPIDEAMLNAYYAQYEQDDCYWAMTAFDESGVVGHLTMKFTDDSKKTVRLGFIIVDDSKRGCGYGKEMINLAVQYAAEMLKAERITLGVFENNPPAYHCYKSAGFNEISDNPPAYRTILGQQWLNIEMELLLEH